jgi:hypothetical protein
VSYCRWSSDWYRSDVYVYESDDGFVTHVAATRWVHATGLPCPRPATIQLPDLTAHAAIALAKAQDEWFANCRLENIGLPYDGRGFTDGSPRECAETLAMLAGCGYRVPDGVIETLLEEQAELDRAARP